MIFSPPEEGIPVIRKRRSPRIMFANSVLSNNTHNTPISIDTSNNIRAPQSANANSGSGGGGGNSQGYMGGLYSPSSGSGGSGIVMVRYQYQG